MVEWQLQTTPVDVAGRGDDTLVVGELEWRRADPADNTASLFRHLETGRVSESRIVVGQLFTAYYDLARGGVSSKRNNAEFVGRAAARTDDRLTYRPIRLGIEPPTADGSLEDGWKAAVSAATDEFVALIE